MGDSFRVEDYDQYGDRRGTLNILGGLIQRERGPVGTGNATGVFSGYGKNYVYDTRFLENSTPGFPKVTRFDVENWRETTRVKKIQ